MAHEQEKKLEPVQTAPDPEKSKGSSPPLNPGQQPAREPEEASEETQSFGPEEDSESEPEEESESESETEESDDSASEDPPASGPIPEGDTTQAGKVDNLSGGLGGQPKRGFPFSK